MKAKPWWQVAASPATSDDGARSSLTFPVAGAHWSPTARARMRREFRLVGHRDYQAAIRQVYAAWGGRGHAVRTTVRIVRMQNRIYATTLTGTVVGCFSQNDTASYSGVIAAMFVRFDEIRCAAIVEMDWDGELFIALDIASPMECAAMTDSAHAAR